MAEAFDVADRGRFYDRTGAIRDVVQNHMLQVLATVLADPPDGSGLDDSWLDAKARVVAALRPLTTADVVRGQYEGYRDVDGVDPNSTTESYVAVRLALDTWRWAGVPIVIRAGKTMPVTATEVNVRFRPVPFDVFGAGSTRISNSLRFRIWPETQIGITLAGKKPGAGREAERRTWCSPSRAGPTCARTTGSSALPSTASGCCSPGRTRWRPRGGSSTPCSVTSSPCTPTPAAAGDPRRPTLCCPTATPGTTQPAEPQLPRWLWEGRSRSNRHGGEGLSPREVEPGSKDHNHPPGRMDTRRRAPQAEEGDQPARGGSAAPGGPGRLRSEFGSRRRPVRHPAPGDLSTERHRLPARVTTYWRWRAFCSSLPLLILLIILAIYLPWGPWWIRWGIVGLFVVVVAACMIVVPGIRYRVFWYAISEKEIDVQSGIIFTTRSVVPMHRVQSLRTDAARLPTIFGWRT